MPAEFTTSILKCAPSGAAGVSVTPNASSGVNSSWVEIEASTSAAWVLAGIDVRGKVSGGVFYEAYYEVDIGVGAAGSETVICTMPGLNGGGSTCHGDAVIPIPIDLIPSSSRVSCRLRRWNETDVTAWNISIWYYEKPVAGSVTITDSPLKVLNASGTPFNRDTNSSTAWAYGAWTQIIASTATDIIIPGLWVICGQNGARWELEIGIGAAGSEVGKRIVRGGEGANYGTPLWVPFFNPMDGIASGTRVAVRSRGSAWVTVYGVITYQEKPL